MKKEFKNRLKEFLEISAMSRYEEPVVDELKKTLNKLDFSLSRDNFGSLIAYKKAKSAKAPKVMIAAHMDEVGFLVRSIDSKGQLLLYPVGGIWPTTVVGTKAVLITSENKKYNGVFGHTSIHIMEREKVTKALTNKELYADFGFSSDKEALEHGVQVGDRVAMTGESVELFNDDLVAGKAMDNRAGVAVLEQVAKEVSDLKLDVNLYLVWTVQEEVGTRGAITSTSLVDPDIAIALDTTSSHDTINTIPGTTSLGKGAALRVFDNGMMADPKLISFLLKVAKKHKVKAYKFVSMGGGTDASSMQYAKGGAATTTLSLPQRYLHSPIGICSVSDLLETKKLLVNFVKELTTQKYEKEIKYS
ncbi:M42 family metallopeptidase [Mycoplasmopsis synoviae]|uniref:M20/M25/M40 family metallo-hydrolase n=1 Tax=Mycoplasmopsis synoviae TaxID=2109 RepID=UPI0012A8AFFE|nr:M42 family metallopeptidase [Mycoplasmopsis synoviae]QGL45390.1 M42 family peptidase [Mycoplasmopsis synoviae]QXV99403.1 M42 family metallopeptidase [Mycoplasmopsis synoviae]UBM43587.1 M42 family metallopeptidase [Mycoplasmopsis synoviae]UBX98236.1 M42 family metallopeptidase [Mycoplasmopsis synoviae]ULL02350.1 M42 family metallopeptidase [Mycoplasmopsis synoviae]